MLARAAAGRRLRLSDACLLVQVLPRRRLKRDCSWWQSQVQDRAVLQAARRLLRRRGADWNLRQILFPVRALRTDLFAPDCSEGSGLDWTILHQFSCSQRPFAVQVNKNRGGQRTMTVLMYLNAAEARFDAPWNTLAANRRAALLPFRFRMSAALRRSPDHLPPPGSAFIQEGGETIFPLAGGGGQCKCGNTMQKGLCVKPRKGSAVLFMSLTPAGVEDARSLHGSCDVVKVRGRQ